MSEPSALTAVRGGRLYPDGARSTTQVYPEPLFFRHPEQSEDPVAALGRTPRPGFLVGVPLLGMTERKNGGTKHVRGNP